jgi:hypothetical protein
LNPFSKNIFINGLFNIQNLDVKEYLLERERERERERDEQAYRTCLNYCACAYNKLFPSNKQERRNFKFSVSRDFGIPFFALVSIPYRLN